MYIVAAVVKCMCQFDWIKGWDLIKHYFWEKVSLEEIERESLIEKKRKINIDYI